ncbi:hypothetical protein DPX39_000069300 [Trypanosoma brucei equiperdum]|uniref:Uncharacterized protein n=1 Tax=Trypanosoma brucei equiperdum TaxID=630700 RepID=A0A3L6KQX5_9TRYP|nr:hypothetical protein DPX39_000069300 [Trypanosoma brucei equiperdum]
MSMCMNMLLFLFIYHHLFFYCYYFIFLCYVLFFLLLLSFLPLLLLLPLSLLRLIRFFLFSLGNLLRQSICLLFSLFFFFPSF